jgi:hypothetical protein
MGVWGTVRWVVLVVAAALIAVAALGSRGPVGQLTDADEVAIYTAVLDDRLAATPPSARRFVVDVRHELTRQQREQLSLRERGPWVEDVSEVALPDAANLVVVDSLYPAKDVGTVVKVDVGTLCGKTCSSSTRYTLERAGGAWRVTDERAVSF